jgi:16S rRNA (guanine527-N7)-methyltransferase
LRPLEAGDLSGLIDEAAASAVLRLFERAQELGFLGPGPVEDHFVWSLAFARAAGAPPERGVDLGTGGGVPGLVLALVWQATDWTFVESNNRRADWLKACIAHLGLQKHCYAICERAEVVGRGGLRYDADLVTARSFAPAGPTAECGAPLLKVGGQLLVSEPPDLAGARWPEEGLALLGLVMKDRLRVATSAGPMTFARMESKSPTPDRYPRRVGVPFKRQLF